MKQHLLFIFCIISLGLTAQLPSYVPTNGLIGWWPFNGNANDESGNGNNGTVNGATLTTDRFGLSNKAYSFNSNYISVPHNSLFNFETNNSVTVSLWFNTTNKVGSVFVQKQSGVGATQNGFNVGFLNSNTNLAGISQKATGSMSIISTPSSIINSNTWYHLVYVFNNGVASLYVNGQLILNQTDPGSQVGNSITDLIFGYGLPSNNAYYNGKLDDIAIYNRALTQQEITNLYSGSSPPTITTTASPTLINCGESTTLTASSTSAAQPCLKADLPANLQNGLVGYWPFCGNANDASGNNNNGTVNGATLTSDRFGNANSAYSFDGDSRIRIPYSSNYSSQTGTVCTWIYINQLPSILDDQDVLFGKSWGYPQLVLRNDGKITISLANATNNFTVLSSNSVLYVNNWYFISAKYSPSSLSISINGVLDNTTNSTSSFYSYCNSEYFIGGFNHLNSCMPNDNVQNITSKLDDIYLYNRALTATEIQQLYTLGNVNYSWSPGNATTSSITVSPTQTSTYTCTASNLAGSSTSSITVNVADTLTWSGTVDTNWHKPCNWNPQFVPKCCNNVLVPFTSNQPVVSGIAAAEDVTINSTSGAVIRVNAGANLQVGVCPITITQTACPSLAVITTTAVSSITQATAISGGIITYQGVSAVTARGICWSTSANPTLANSFTTNGSGVGTFTANLTGLTAGTTYYVRAFATNTSGTSYGNEVSFSTQTLAAQYPAGSVFCATGPTVIVDVTNPTTGKTWMDRNLGASQVATSSADAAAYGDLYQWGRGTDGHQCRTSATTSTLSSSDQPGNGNFIFAPNSPWDWRNSQNTNLWQGVNGVNNPCPSGYRLPTEIEFDNERLSWSSNSELGAIGSLIKLPSTGYRNGSGGMLAAVGSYGYYWVSTLLAAASKDIYFGGGNSAIQSSNRANGLSVRCIKDATPLPATIGAINCNSMSVTGTVTAGVAASNVTIAVPYIGANGGYYGLQTISSTGVTGLTITLAAGIIANGAGILSLVVSGTPSSSGVANFPINIGGQSCTISVTVNALTTQYAAGSVFCAAGPTAIVDVTNPTTGKTWMDRNLGASQAATSATDASAYGDLYQWGRRTDGHQCRTSATTSTLSSSDQPGHGNFIINAPDWRNPQNDNLWQGVNGTNNPCPSGYRVPTNTELNAERASWSSQNSNGAINSVLKWPMSGAKQPSDASFYLVGSRGYYWSSTINGTESYNFHFYSSIADWLSSIRAHGIAVRCIKN
jgi:uncharacterized protein (TIGR02145 family)